MIVVAVHSDPVFAVTIVFLTLSIVLALVSADCLFPGQPCNAGACQLIATPCAAPPPDGPQPECKPVLACGAGAPLTSQCTEADADCLLAPNKLGQCSADLACEGPGPIELCRGLKDGDKCDDGVCRFAPRQCPVGRTCPLDLPLQCVAVLPAKGKPQCTGKFFGQPCESSDGKAGACDALPSEPDFFCKVGDKPLPSSCSAPKAGCLVADELGLCSSDLVCRRRNGPSGECERGLKDGDACKENGVCRFSPRQCPADQPCQTDLELLCYSFTSFLPCSRAMTACVTEKGAKGLCSGKLVCESTEGPSDTSGFANVLQLSAAAIMVSFTTLQ
jgi:hypothetical protein